jgi:hypothetical protein
MEHATRWIEKDDSLRIDGKYCTVYLTERPNYCDRGNWLAQLDAKGDLARDIDESDGWPRYYFDLERAKAEIVAWLVRRNQL